MTFIIIYKLTQFAAILYLQTFLHFDVLIILPSETFNNQIQASIT